MYPKGPRGAAAAARAGRGARRCSGSRGGGGVNAGTGRTLRGTRWRAAERRAGRPQLAAAVRCLLAQNRWDRCGAWPYLIPRGYSSPLPQHAPSAHSPLGAAAEPRSPDTRSSAGLAGKGPGVGSAGPGPLSLVLTEESPSSRALSRGRSRPCHSETSDCGV